MRHIPACHTAAETKQRDGSHGLGLRHLALHALQAERLYSPDRSVFLVPQTDGNLVIYNAYAVAKLGHTAAEAAIWESGTYNNGGPQPFTLAMQEVSPQKLLCIPSAKRQYMSCSAVRTAVQLPPICPLVPILHIYELACVYRTATWYYTTATLRTMGHATLAMQYSAPGHIPRCSVPACTLWLGNSCSSLVTSLVQARRAY